MIKFFKKSFIFSTITLEILALIFIFVLYLSSSQKTLNYIANIATKDLNISYKKISGSLLDFIEIDDLRYKDLKIAQKAKISWSMLSFIKQKPVIKDLIIEDLDISSIEKLISKSTKTSTNQKELKLPQLDINRVHLSLTPYKNRYIDLKKLTLNINDIDIKDKSVTTKNFDIDLKSDLANINSKGEIYSKKLLLSQLNIEKIDLKKIENLIKDLNQTKNSQNSFDLINRVVIKKLNGSILPYNYEKYKVDTLNITANSVDFDIQKELLNIQKLSIDSNSNIATILADGIVGSNRVFLKTKLKFKKEYLKKIDSIFDLSTVGPIDLKLQADKDKIFADLSLKSGNIFKKEYEIKINSLKSIVEYNINDKTLKAKTLFKLFSKYANEITGTNYLRFKKHLKYHGDINISKLQHFPKYSLKLFKDANIKYIANESNLTATLKTDKLKLLYKMFDYKKADFYLSSDELNISNYFKLPKNLEPLQAKVDGAFMKLDFKHTKNIKIDTNISSNAIDLSGVFDFKNGINFIAKSTLSKDSILQQIDKNIKFKDILNSDLNISYKDKKLHITNINNLLQTIFFYDSNTTNTDLNFKIDNSDLKLSGDLKNLKLNTKIYSLKEFQKSLKKIYDINISNFDGEVELNSTISDLSNFKANIKSRWFVYEYKKNHFAFAEKIKISLDGNKDEINIRDYKLSAYIYDANRDLFATKNSKITIKDKKIRVEEFWLNDSLKTTGFYDLKNSLANFRSYAKVFNYKGKEGDIKAKIDLKSTIEKNKTLIKGAITLLDALIKYRYKKEHTISDPDIIIIQEQEKIEEKKREKRTALVLDISINTIKDIIYNQDGIDVKVRPDLMIWKESFKDLELLGRVEIIKGKYKIEDKEFDIQNGEILFGGDITNPYLSINAKYYTNPYDITINITGTLAAPQLNFSSTPYLNQSDILSLLLFDSTSESIFNQKSSSTNTALRFLGNRFAKEIVGKLGIRLDRLVILTNEKGGLGFEIGKKISKKATIIYINDIVQTIKVKYQHSNHFETDLTISPESSGIEFIYKNEQ